VSDQLPHRETSRGFITLRGKALARRDCRRLVRLGCRRGKPKAVLEGGVGRAADWLVQGEAAEARSGARGTTGGG